MRATPIAIFGFVFLCSACGGGGAGSDDNDASRTDASMNNVDGGGRVDTDSGPGMIPECVDDPAPIPEPNAGCEEATTLPAGQANPSIFDEPMGAIWCFDTVVMPTTRMSGDNSWVDEFQTCEQMGRLNDGDMDYRIFDNQGGLRSVHWVNNNHWIVDMLTIPDGGGGAMLRPNRSFREQDGKLVVEADVAAAQEGYEGDADNFVSLDVSNAPQPTGDVRDAAYGYGQFGGYWAVGCRLQPGRGPICSLFQPENVNLGGPSSASGGRIWEISSHQIEPGADKDPEAEGGPFGELEDYWRVCADNEDERFCRDRFRLELTRTSLTLYVNGRAYFRQTARPDANIPGLPEGQLLPNELFEQDTYAYFTDWHNFPRDQEKLLRFHWGRIAVNPTDGPSASPSFCLGEPENTCPLE